MNEIDIDPAAHAAEQQSLIYSAQALEPAPTPTPPASAPEPAFNAEEFSAQAQTSWMANVQGLTGLAVVYGLPQWQIQPEELKPFNEALCECLETVFPGGVNGKYACWWKLILAGSAITLTRYMANGNKLPPIGPVKPVTVSPAQPEPSSAAA